MIYFVLLTLWGMEYMRETKRLKKLIMIANSTGKPVQDIEVSQLSSPGSMLTILWPLGPGAMAYVFTLINVGGLLLASTLIILRYLAAFNSI